jgi:hypothetical protein
MLPECKKAAWGGPSRKTRSHGCNCLLPVAHPVTDCQVGILRLGRSPGRGTRARAGRHPMADPERIRDDEGEGILLHRARRRLMCGSYRVTGCETVESISGPHAAWQLHLELSVELSGTGLAGRLDSLGALPAPPKVPGSGPQVLECGWDHTLERRRSPALCVDHAFRGVK